LILDWGNLNFNNNLKGYNAHFLNISSFKEYKVYTMGKVSKTTLSEGKKHCQGLQGDFKTSLELLGGK